VLAFSFPASGVLIVHSDCTQTLYTSDEDTNSSRGTALVTAVAAVTDGDVFYLSKGGFNIGTSIIDLSKNDTISSSLYGSGMDETIIIGNYTAQNILKLGNNVRIVDVGMNIPVTGFYSTAIGKTTGDATNFLIQNVRVKTLAGGCLYILAQDYLITGNIINFQCDSSFSQDDQAFYFTGNASSDVNVFDSNIISNGQIFSEAVRVELMKVTIYDSYIECNTPPGNWAVGVITEIFSNTATLKYIILL